MRVKIKSCNFTKIASKLHKLHFNCKFFSKNKKDSAAAVSDFIRSPGVNLKNKSGLAPKCCPLKLKKGVDFNRKWHQFHERVHFWGVGFIFKGKGSKLRVGVQLDFEP